MVFIYRDTYVLKTFISSNDFSKISKFNIVKYNDCNNTFSIENIDLNKTELENVLNAESIFVVCDENLYQEQLVMRLKYFGVKKVYIPKQYEFQNQFPFFSDGNIIFERVMEIDKDENFIAHIETHITDYCNLNCEACNNFAPFFEYDSCNDLDLFSKDLISVMNCFDKIGRLYLLGGEPLLKPQLTVAFIKKARAILPYTEIRLLTNGLLIPKMTDVFFDVIKENDIILQVTVYPPTYRIIDEIKALLNQHCIKQNISQKVDYFIKRLSEKVDTPDLSTRNSFICKSGGCHYFRDGYISKCPDAALVKKLDDKEGTSYFNENDLIKITGNGNDILKQLNVSALCSRCSQTPELIAWNTVNASPTKEQWILDYKKDVSRRISEYYDEKGLFKDYEFVAFGAGKCFRDHITMLKEGLQIRYVVDTNLELHDKMLHGCRCISSVELKKIDRLVVIITVYQAEMISEIMKILQHLGIKRVFHIEELLRFVFANP